MFHCTKKLSPLALVLIVGACDTQVDPTIGLGGPECPARASVSRSPASDDVDRTKSAVTRACGEDVDTFYFGPGDSVLGPRGRAKADALASCLKDPSLVARNVVIRGHADWRGEVGENIELALRRANAVKEQLESRGIDSRRIRTESRGEREAGCGAPEVGDRRARVLLEPVRKTPRAGA